MEKALVPLLWAPLPRITRLRYLAFIFMTKGLMRFGWLFRKLLICLGRVPRPSGQPTLTKYYPSRPRLRHQVFFPKAYKQGETLPLYINVHGGGFAFGSPEHDQEFCVFFANRFNLLVVSVSYSLSPWATFPTPTHDVGAVVGDILADSELPIDHTRVALGGFSAGGNLALSACQLPELQGRIRAVIPWYAPVDWTVDYPVKIASRPYKRPTDVDSLASVAPILNNVYLRTGTDQRDPLLSIVYADRAALPEWIYAISAEYDMLADEARRLMGGLAGLEEMTGEERVAFERDGGRLKWSLVKGAKHSFTHWWLKRGKNVAATRPIAEKWFVEAGTWLTEKAFADES